MRPIKAVIVHHSAGPEHTTVAQVDAEHKRRGFRCIGYHFLIHRLYKGGPWVISVGRPLDQVGAHDEGQNDGTIGVCIAGDYSEGGYLDEWGWRLLIDFVAQLCAQFKLTADNVEGHREHEPPETPTACPGFDLERLRRYVKGELG